MIAAAACRRGLPRSVTPFSLFLFSVAFSFPVSGNTVTWINPAGGAWTDPGNWSTDQLPGPNDDVTISNIADPYNAPVVLNTGDQIVHSVTGPFTLAGAASLSAASVSGITLQGGTLRNADILNGSFAVGAYPSFPTLCNVTLSADLALNGGNVTVTNGMTFNGHSISIDYGAIEFVGTQTLSGSGGVGLGYLEQSSSASFHGTGGTPSTLTIGPGVGIGGDGSFDTNDGSSIVLGGGFSVGGGDGVYSYDFDDFSTNAAITTLPTAFLVSADNSDLFADFTWNDPRQYIYVGHSNISYISALHAQAPPPSAKSSGGGPSIRVGPPTLHLYGEGVLSVPANAFAIDGNALLDIDSAALVVDYDIPANSPLTTIRALAIKGYNHGAWDGVGGITSSFARNDPYQRYGLAVIESADCDGLSGYWRDQVIFGLDPYTPGIDSTAVIVRYTLYGDNDLNGSVNDGISKYQGEPVDDFQLFLRGLHGKLSGWIGGDYNYDGVTDIDHDFVLFARGFGDNQLLAEDIMNYGYWWYPAITDIPTPEERDEMLAILGVPEPTAAIALVPLVTLVTLRRRR